MCGIVGAVGLGRPIEVAALQRMNDLQAHRGPDGEGFLLGWVNGGRFSHTFLSHTTQRDTDTPVTVGLVIDDSRSMAPKLAEVIAAAAAFARSSNAQDELFAVAFNDNVQEHIGGRALSVADPAGLEKALSALVPQGRTALYDALVAALQRAAETTRPRKVLILISDGGDNASETTLKQVLARARQSNVTIYTIGLFDADDADRNPGVLKSLAQTTGGERFLPDTPARLMQACQHIAREIRSGYTIGYVPPDRDGAYHRVRVDVRSPDGRRISVRTRPGYFAASPVTRP